MEGSDFLDLPQTPEDLDIEYDITGLSLDLVDVTAQEGFKYPAMVITGVVFQDTLKVLKRRVRDSFRAFDVWLDMEDGSSPTNIGTLPLEMETLLVMRYLGVRVTVYLTPDEVETLDLSDASVLERFM